jgi:hypothetical protein
MLGIHSILMAGVLLTQASNPPPPDQPAPAPNPSVTDLEPVQEQSGHSLSFLLDAQVEYNEIRQKIVDSHNNVGLTREELEQGLRFSNTRDTGLLRATLEIPISYPTRIRIFGAGGVEQASTHLTAGPENPVFGNPVGTTETDFEFGLSPVWDAGAEFRLGLGDTFDLTATGDARGGSDTEEDSATKESSHYRRYRGGLFAGWTVTPGIRPYLGAHYSYERTKFKLTDKTSGAEAEFHTADELPVDAAVGVELSSSPIVGAIEVDFVSRVTILVSAGIRF